LARLIYEGVTFPWIERYSLSPNIFVLAFLASIFLKTNTMIFSVSLILLAALASPTLAKVDIRRNFLSEEEVEKFRQEFTESNLRRLGEERVQYKTNAIGTGLQSELFALLLGNKNNPDTERSDGESSCKVTQTMPELHLSQIVKTTTPHQDIYHENVSKHCFYLLLSASTRTHTHVCRVPSGLFLANP
jgi:hypothetical protein